MKYTREDLIDICEKAIVKQSNWANRDSAQSQMKVGICLVLLKAGCEFEIQTSENNPSGNCITNEKTIWIQFYVCDFQYFEGGIEDDRGNTDDGCECYHYYLPTRERLKDVDGKDWY